MDIGHDNEAIFRNQCTNMHKQHGTEGVLTCLIEIIESGKTILDKLREIDPTFVCGMHMISQDLQDVLQNLRTVRAEIYRQRRK